MHIATMITVQSLGSHQRRSKGIRAGWWLSWLRICLQCKRPGLDPWIGKIPWRRERLPTLVFLPGEFHEQGSLVGYSLRGHKISDMTERLMHNTFFSLSLILYFYFIQDVKIFLGLIWMVHNFVIFRTQPKIQSNSANNKLILCSKYALFQ